MLENVTLVDVDVALSINLYVFAIMLQLFHRL
jgi:hypothetical protein